MTKKHKNKSGLYVSRWQRFLSLGGVSRKQILIFTKNLSILLKSGSSLSEAIFVLGNQIKGKLKIILSDVYFEIQKGTQLSVALAKHPREFPDIYVSIIQIGEHSGTLEENIVYLANQLAKNNELRRSVWGAMLYPIIVLIGSVIIGMTIAIFVLPKIAKIFINFNIELPFTTRMLIAVANFFQDYGVWAVLGLILLVILTAITVKLNSVKPFLHWLILRTPFIRSISLNFNLILFCRTLGLLLKSGVTIDDGMQICTKTITNVTYKRFLTKAYNRIKAGDNLAEIVNGEKTLFPETDVQILQVGERSGTLSDALEYCANLHEDALNNITKNLANVLEPILLVVIGVLVAVLALSIITPIYSITDQFRA